MLFVAFLIFSFRSFALGQISNLIFSPQTNLNSDHVREQMKNRYLSNPDYNFEKVNRASMACGPMVKWAIAQVYRLGTIFPPRNE